MNQEFKPSADFVATVMRRVYRYEADKVPFFQWLLWSRQARYLLAGGGTVVGIFTALPVF